MHRTVAIALLAAHIAASAAPVTLGELVRGYRAASTPAGRSAIEAYARAHGREPSGALADFALGVSLFENKDFASAAGPLVRAHGNVPRLKDYTAYYLAASEDALGQPAAVLDAVSGVAGFAAPFSPLLARAAILEAKAMSKLGTPNVDALAATQQALRGAYANLPQPDGDFALALILDAQAENAQAATFYQRVYFLHPATQMAAEASAAIERLKRSLGPAYPPAPPYQMLERGQKWIDAKEYSKARAEFQAIVPLLSGLERDQARVRIGAAMYTASDYRGAAQYLKALDLPRSDADAERYYYLEECARRMNRDDEMMDAIKELGRHHERSVWRLKALVSAGNRYLLTHQPDRYDPLYRAAASTFPSDSATAYCHWKITWDAYLGNKRDAQELLREQVEHYPEDTKAATALYYLGRLAESQNQYGDAQLYYTRLVALFPNYYYATLARDRLAQSRVVAGTPTEKGTVWLDAVEFPPRADYSSQTPNEATRLRIERARLLVSAGLSDFAEAEIRFGARTDGQPHLLAIELARTDAAPYLSLKHMKSLSPDYLSTPVDRAPKTFWQMLFPLPYQSALVASARRQNLDPYMVAALIRQESEFNPGAHSPANAYGLTQIVPATGRMLARQQGIRGFSPNILYQPETNLRLGTSYLRSLLDQWNGRWEQTLASYNAGKSRVDEWLAWGSYREPAEFVESIPFTETREYVQAIIRNAALYRQIYGAAPALAAAADERETPVMAPVSRSAARRATHPAKPHAAVSARKRPKLRTAKKPKAKTKKRSH